MKSKDKNRRPKSVSALSVLAPISEEALDFKDFCEEAEFQRRPTDDIWKADRYLASQSVQEELEEWPGAEAATLEDCDLEIAPSDLNATD